MTKAVLAAITLSALLCACASSEIVWTKKGGRVTTEDVRADAGQCQAQAYGDPVVTRVRSVFAYNTCMREKGWYQVEIPTLRYDIGL